MLLPYLWCLLAFFYLTTSSWLPSVTHAYPRLLFFLLASVCVRAFTQFLLRSGYIWIIAAVHIKCLGLWITYLPY